MSADYEHQGFLAHLPTVALDGAQPLDLGQMFVVAKGFPDWLRYEGLHAHDWDRYYGESQTFVAILHGVTPAKRIAQPMQMLQTATADAATVWRTLLLSYRAFIPHPQLSLLYAAYHRSDGYIESVSQHGFGGFDLLRYPPRLILRPDDEQLLARNLGQLDFYAVQSLESLAVRLESPFSRCVTSAPDSWEYVQFVCQLEHLLNPDGVGPLRSEFAARLCTLCVDESRDAAFWDDVGHVLYRFKSRSLHGQDIESDVARLGALGTDLYPVPYAILEKAMLLLHAAQMRAIRERIGDAAAIRELVTRSLARATPAEWLTPDQRLERIDGRALVHADEQRVTGPFLAMQRPERPT